MKNILETLTKDKKKNLPWLLLAKKKIIKLSGGKKNNKRVRLKNH